MIAVLVISVLAACAPAPDETGDLPTLARFPSETATSAEDIDLTQAASLRTPLPASFTPTFTPTLTPTLDPSVTPTLTLTASVTPSATITNTPSITPTEPPPLSPDDRPILGIVELARNATVLPTDYQVPAFGGPDITLIPQDTATLAPGIPSPIPPLGATSPPTGNTETTPICGTTTSGGFLTIYQSNSAIANQLGCPSGTVQSIPSAWQNFENGIMVWLNGEIIVFYNNTGTYQTFPDTFVDGVDPETTSEVPPAGLVAPIRGFLKVWSNNINVRNGLGWGTTGENGTTASVQAFTSGRMIFLPGRSGVLVLIGTTGGTWISVAGSY